MFYACLRVLKMYSSLLLSYSWNHPSPMQCLILDFHIVYFRDPSISIIKGLMSVFTTTFNSIVRVSHHLFNPSSVYETLAIINTELFNNSIIKGLRH